MKIRSEYKVSLEYMPPKLYGDKWCRSYIGNKIIDKMLEEGLIKFSEFMENGRYVLAGEVLCENPARAKEIGEWLVRSSIDNQNKI